MTSRGGRVVGDCAGGSGIAHPPVGVAVPSEGDSGSAYDAAVLGRCARAGRRRCGRLRPGGAPLPINLTTSAVVMPQPRPFSSSHTTRCSANAPASHPRRPSHRWPPGPFQGRRLAQLVIPWSARLAWVDLCQPVGVRGVNPVVPPALDRQAEQVPDGEAQQGAAALIRHECGMFASRLGMPIYSATSVASETTPGSFIAAEPLRSMRDRSSGQKCVRRV